jgi:hypothetical protein
MYNEDSQPLCLALFSWRTDVKPPTLLLLPSSPTLPDSKTSWHPSEEFEAPYFWEDGCFCDRCRKQLSPWLQELSPWLQTGFGGTHLPF